MIISSHVNYDACMSTIEDHDKTPLPRIEELKAATQMEGDKLRDFLITMVKSQFSLVSDDPIDIMMGGLTISAMVQTIINDMVAVNAPQPIVQSLIDVQWACENVTKVCAQEQERLKDASSEKEPA